MTLPFSFCHFGLDPESVGKPSTKKLNTCFDKHIFLFILLLGNAMIADYEEGLMGIDLYMFFTKIVRTMRLLECYQTNIA